MSTENKALATIMLVVDPEHPDAVETLTGPHIYLIDELEEAVHSKKSALVDGAVVVDINYKEKVSHGIERREDGKLDLCPDKGENKTIYIDGWYSKQDLASLLFEMTRQETEEQT
jgi:hypothetical protein